MEPPTVVIDNGTGYTKMGYAGNLEPSYMIPSVLVQKDKAVSVVILFIYTCLFYRKVISLTTLILSIGSVMRPWPMRNKVMLAIC